jgi:hypothetical protein
MWYPTGSTCINVLEGHAVYLGADRALVSCTGAATLSRNATAQPCLLVARNGANIRKVTKAFFWAAQLNYGHPGKAHRYAQPLRETDKALQRRLEQEARGIR